MTDSISREVALRLAWEMYQQALKDQRRAIFYIEEDSAQEEIHARLESLTMQVEDRAPEPPASSETVEVRIAVAVDEHGYWNAAGWNEPGGLSLDDVSHVRDFTMGETRVSWITAHAPKPSPPKEIAGEVERQVERG